MAKKRKSDVTRLDEVDRTIFTTFCSAANSLSQLYTQATHQQKLSFQAGERQALEKLYNWISRQEEDGSRVTTGDIMGYMQNELEYGGDQPPVSPRLPFQQQQAQTPMNFSNSNIPASSNPFAPATAGHGQRSGQFDQQAKNSVFSNALSSPVRRSLQNYHLSHGGYFSNNVMSSANGPQNIENSYHHNQNRESNTVHSNDSSMDMHADSPSQESPY